MTYNHLFDGLTEPNFNVLNTGPFVPTGGFNVQNIPTVSRDISTVEQQPLVPSYEIPKELDSIKHEESEPGSFDEVNIPSAFTNIPVEQFKTTDIISGGSTGHKELPTVGAGELAYRIQGLNQEIFDEKQNKFREDSLTFLKGLDKESLKQLQSELVDAGEYGEDIKSLSKGNVKNLQQMLVDSGFLANTTRKDGSYREVDGIVGKKTEAAYKNYLKHKEVDGILGNRTISAYMNHFMPQVKENSTMWQHNVSTRGVDGCAAWVVKKFQDATGGSADDCGVNYDAWKMPANVVSKGGSWVYNIYDDPDFKGVKSTKALRALTERKIKEHPFDYSQLKQGDIVGIYVPSSNMHAKALREGTTKNTHVGICTGFDSDGTPIIEHNVHGHHKRDRADKLTGSTYGKTLIANVTRPKVVNAVEQAEFAPTKSKFVVAGQEGNKDLNDFADSMAGAADYFNKLFPNADMDEVQKIALSVLRREISFMNNKVSDQTNYAERYDGMGDDIMEGNFSDAWEKFEDGTSAYGRKLYYDLGDAWKYNKHRFNGIRELFGGERVNRQTSENKSSDLAKFKLQTLNINERNLLGIHSIEDLNDPKKAGLASAYTLAKNYDYFKRLQAAYPDLGITDDDIINFTILSYNQGMGRLKNIGFDSRGVSQLGEIEDLRQRGDYNNTYDVQLNETNYRHFGWLGDLMFKAQPREKKQSYIGSAKEVIEKQVKEQE